MVAGRADSYISRMLEYSTQIEIDAPTSIVWAVLTDTQAWPEWDPFCVDIRTKGELALGTQVTAFTKLAPGRGFTVKVTTDEPEQKMDWTGGMPFGLFKGERTYALQNLGGRTYFTMREVFSGPMLKLIGKTIPDMNEAFESFANGLQLRAESMVSGPAEDLRGVG